MTRFSLVLVLLLLSACQEQSQAPAEKINLGGVTQPQKQGLTNGEKINLGQGETAKKINLGQVLPSWRKNQRSERLYQFVVEASTPGHAQFIPIEQRIAAFDNDGTLWSEQPAYFQLFFAIDRIAELSAQDQKLKQKWQQQPALKAAMNRDFSALMAEGEKGIVQVLMTSHTGNDVSTSSTFRAAAEKWIKEAKHPSIERRFIEMVYQPMLELLAFLKSRDFKVFIVTGGGSEFMRAWASETYGIPSERIIGTQFALEYDYRQGEPVLIRQPRLAHLNDKEGKPVAIHQVIGQKPVLAFGNSDGDLQMLQWTAANQLPHLSAYIHHTDEKREWAYDIDSSIGQLKEGLKQAEKENWLVVDMKQDWLRIYPER